MMVKFLLAIVFTYCCIIQKLVGQNNKCLFHFFVQVRSFKKGLIVWFHSGSLRRLHQDLGWWCGHLKAGPGLQDTLPNWFTHLLLGCLNICNMGLYTELIWVSLSHGSWLPHDWFKREQDRNFNVFLFPNFRSHILPFLQNHGGYTGHLYSLWEKNLPKCEYQETKYHWGHLKRCLEPSFMLKIK